MKIHAYKNYPDYVKAQNEANRAKISNIYVKSTTIEAIVARCPKATSVLCHGTRNGAEQLMFLERLPSANVLGTEISDTAGNFPHTVQWDFHDINPAWTKAWDIVYTNSFDHSIAPQRALDTWRDQLTSNGYLFLEHSPHVKSRRWDPLEIVAAELLELFDQTGLSIRDQWESSSNNQTTTHVYQLESKIS